MPISSESRWISQLSGSHHTLARASIKCRGSRTQIKRQFMPMSSHRCLQLIRHTPPEICMKNYTRLISACVTFPRKANLAACVFPLWSEINVHPCPQSFDPYYTGNWVSGSYTGICFPFFFFFGLGRVSFFNSNRKKSPTGETVWLIKPTVWKSHASG